MRGDERLVIKPLETKIISKSMFLQRKALYNLIQLNISQIERGELKIADLQAWQITNYRDKTTDELFKELNSLGILLVSGDFEVYGKNFEAPEEMVEVLAKERPPLEKDQIFLILFELWRRFFPERRTISIFCDELDHQMMAYDLEKPNEIADSLAALQLLLDEHVDQGLNPPQALELIQIYCANDIESFLFDYILAEIEGGNSSYATELIDGFKRYVKGSPWFAYLEARCLILDDPEEGFEKLEHLIETIHDRSYLELLNEMLFFLANSGNHSLFYTVAKKVSPFLKTEEDFKVFLEACYLHYDYLELKYPALAIAKIFYARASVSNDSHLSQADPALCELRSILDKKLHFAEE